MTSTTQLDLFRNDRLLNDLWTAYFDARKHKRNTMNALHFELDLEHNIHQLYEEIFYGTYKISPSICFIVNRPVKREVFAAHFRDRVVHHLVINKLLPLFENQFIYDSYSCRVGKGTLFGIRRLQKFIRSCTDNYRKEAFVLKLDIQGFFMSIRKSLLLAKVEDLIQRKYNGDDKELLLSLVRQIILNDPTQGCIVKGRRSDWKGLPANKSLFSTPKDCGLPIGNITSQVFANYYLNDFDHFMKEKLKLKYYGRYVDDFFVVHEDKTYLRSLVPLVREYLFSVVGVVLHPRKIYLQSCMRGVQFVGAYIAPFRTYLSKRTVTNFKTAMREIALLFPDSVETHNYASLQSRLSTRLSDDERGGVAARINSYLGLCRHFNTARMCRAACHTLPEVMLQCYAFGVGCEKITFVRCLRD
ncbi:MAG: hypothetical protein IJK22_04985 [Bacteroidales bacterium]|nr:hypothetical protein [Bacteroidales bacterium]